jgi:predicted phosphodiesterase
MRIAILSDVHGNLVALDAVLADAEAMAVDAYWVLGDHAALGPEPGAVLDRLCSLDNARCTRGNTDRYVLTGETSATAPSSSQVDTTVALRYAAVVASFAWTKGFVTARGKLDWLAELPLDIRFTCADGVRVLAIHASPGTDDGDGMHPGLSNAEIEELVAVAGADLIVSGHTHEPLIRRIGRQVVVNVGSVSNPVASDIRASYAILESSRGGSTIAHRRVSYDTAAFAESVRRSRHPSADYILGFQRGEHAGRTPHRDDAPVVPGIVESIAR